VAARLPPAGLLTILASDRVVSRAVSLLRRASDDIEKSETRRFFIPRGVPFEIDLNVLGAALLRGLARGIERKNVRDRRGDRC